MLDRYNANCFQLTHPIMYSQCSPVMTQDEWEVECPEKSHTTTKTRYICVKFHFIYILNVIKYYQ